VAGDDQLNKSRNKLRMEHNAQLIYLELDPTDKDSYIEWKTPTGTFILHASDVMNFFIERETERYTGIETR
jgi:hypothetical protein